MNFSKKKLLSLIQENINEMAMDYDTPDRPHTDVTSKLATGETPLKKVPLPRTGNEPNNNFQELLASERYRQVVAKVRQYTGDNTPMNADRNVGQLAQTMMNAHNNIVRTEMAHREELQQLAVELVTKEMGIPEGAFQFDVKIVGMGEIDDSDFNRENPEQQNEPQMPEVNTEVEIDLMNDLEQLNLEKAKRRLINSMIQGASKKGHYMYHLVPERIQQITGSDNLVNQYGILMSINDTLYWQLGDQTMQQMMSGGGIGGKEEVDRNTDPPTIRVRALNFPICVHEIIKGIMEVFAVQGQPSDEDMNQRVSESEDTLEKEMWDLRLGPAIWDRVRLQFPEDILTDENRVELQNYLFQGIVQLPAKKFLVFMKEVISSSENGKRLLNELMENIYKKFNGEEIEEDTFDDDLDTLTDETDNDDLKDFLSGIPGITLSNDNDDDEEDDDSYFDELGFDRPKK
jgi:hypothetical protein